MIKKTYIPGKPRNPKLTQASGVSGVSKTEFSGVVGSSHEHFNKATLDKITEANIEVLSKLSLVDGNLEIDANAYSVGDLSAFGKDNLGGGSSGGTDLVSWVDQITTLTDFNQSTNFIKQIGRASCRERV